MQNLRVKISTSQVYMLVIIITRHKEDSCKPKVTSSQKDIANTPKQREMASSLNAFISQNNTTITSKCSHKERKNVIWHSAQHEDSAQSKLYITGQAT